LWLGRRRISMSSRLRRLPRGSWIPAQSNANCHAFLRLQLTKNGRQVAVARIALATEHPHQALRRLTYKVSEILKPDCRVDVVAQLLTADRSIFRIGAQHEFDPALPPQPPGPIRPRRLSWAELIKRVFGIAGQLRWPSACESKIHRDALRCECGKSMRVLAAITEPKVAKRILECMGLPPRAPPPAPARTSGFASDPWLEQTQGAAFDQSPPDDWALGA
jgi:hypothetical protein